MSTSVDSKPRIIGIERVIPVSPSNGKHSNSAGSYRTVFQYDVWESEDRIGTFDSKREAEAFIDGWEKCRGHVRELLGSI